MRRGLFVALAVLLAFAAACSKKSPEFRCKGSVPFCTAKRILLALDDAQRRYHDDHNSYTTEFQKLSSYLENFPKLQEVYKEPSKLVLTNSAREFELTIKLYKDHLRIKIDPPPKSPSGKLEPFCIMRRYGKDELQACEYLI